MDFALKFIFLIFCFFFMISSSSHSLAPPSDIFVVGLSDSSCLHYSLEENSCSGHWQILFSYINQILLTKDGSSFEKLENFDRQYLLQLSIEDILGVIPEKVFDDVLDHTLPNSFSPPPFIKLDLAYYRFQQDRDVEVMYNLFIFPPSAITPLHSHTSKLFGEPCFSFGLSGYLAENRYFLDDQAEGRVTFSRSVLRSRGDVSIVYETDPLEKLDQDLHELINPSLMKETALENYCNFLRSYQTSAIVSDEFKKWQERHLGITFHVYTNVTESGSVKEIFKRKEQIGLELEQDEDSVYFLKGRSLGCSVFSITTMA